MLAIYDGFVIYEAPPFSETTGARYSTSFSIKLSSVKIVGYAPRLEIDDETEYLVLISQSGDFNYFNFDTVCQDHEGRQAIQAIESYFGYNTTAIIPTVPYSSYSFYSFILYPAALAGQPLFKPLSWLTIKGFFKNVGKYLGIDGPAGEHLTEEAASYLSTVRK